MAKSDLGWSESNPQTQPVPSPRWMRWLLAGLILLVLAFASHTSGRFAGQVRHQMRHWMTVNFVPFALNKEASHLIAKFQGLRSHSKTHRVLVDDPSWRAPVAAARLRQSFGWHGSGTRAQFQPNVILDVTPKSFVLAGVRGRIVKVSRQMVQFTAHGYQIAIFPLTPARLGTAQTLGPTTRLGSTAASTLTLEVTRDSYPVNPLLAALYGTEWLNH